jgi:hypothetical protein
MQSILRICLALDKANVKYAIVGGYAVALHGVVRGTVVLDVIINHTEEAFVDCEKTLIGLGFKSRLPVTAKQVFQFRAEYIEHRNLIAWSFYNLENPIEIIDVIIPYDLASMSTIKKRAFGNQFHVLSIEDLIKIKKISARPQDLEDVKALEALVEGKKQKD